MNSRARTAITTLTCNIPKEIIETISHNPKITQSIAAIIIKNDFLISEYFLKHNTIVRKNSPKNPKIKTPKEDKNKQIVNNTITDAIDVPTPNNPATLDIVASGNNKLTKDVGNIVVIKPTSTNPITIAILFPVNAP